MKKALVLLFLAAVLSLTVVLTASADQVGNKIFAYCDANGAYVHEIDEDDEEVIHYIYFWTEKARKEIMGNYSKPYQNVVRQTKKLCKDGILNLDGLTAK